MKYRIKKVKLDKGLYLEWEEQNGGNRTWDVCSLNSKEQARPELYDAIYAMRRHVVDICELPESAFKRLMIKSVTITHKDEGRGIVISATKELTHSRAPLCLNTPHKSEADEGEFAMSKNLIADMERLIDEAARYINGDRAQGKIFKLHEDDDLGDAAGADDSDVWDEPGQGDLGDYDFEESDRDRPHVA